MSIASMMPSSHLILCRPLLLLPSIFPSTRGFSVSRLFTIRSQTDTVNSILDNYSYFLPSPQTSNIWEPTVHTLSCWPCFLLHWENKSNLWVEFHKLLPPSHPTIYSPTLYLLLHLPCDQLPVKAAPLHPHIRSHSLSWPQRHLSSRFPVFSISPSLLRHICCSCAHLKKINSLVLRIWKLLRKYILKVLTTRKKNSVTMFDVRQSSPHCGDHFPKYTNIESEKLNQDIWNSIMLYVN